MKFTDKNQNRALPWAVGTAGCTVDGHSHSVSSQKGRSLPFSHLHARGKRCGGWSWDGASSVHGARGQGPGRQQLQRWGGALGHCMRPTGRGRTRLVRQGEGVQVKTTDGHMGWEGMPPIDPPPSNKNTRSPARRTFLPLAARGFFALVDPAIHGGAAARRVSRIRTCVCIARGW